MYKSHALLSKRVYDHYHEKGFTVDSIAMHTEDPSDPNRSKMDQTIRVWMKTPYTYQGFPVTACATVPVMGRGTEQFVLPNEHMGWDRVHEDLIPEDKDLPRSENRSDKLYLSTDRQLWITKKSGGNISTNYDVESIKGWPGYDDAMLLDSRSGKKVTGREALNQAGLMAAASAERPFVMSYGEFSEAVRVRNRNFGLDGKPTYDGYRDYLDCTANLCRNLHESTIGPRTLDQAYEECRQFEDLCKAMDYGMHEDKNLKLDRALSPILDVTEQSDEDTAEQNEDDLGPCIW